MMIESPVIKKAKEIFGLTDEFSLAGYILPDGSMLDFAEGQPYQRTLDHRSINQCYEFTDADGDTYNLGMKRFMNEGAIRLNVHSSSAGFDLSTVPTFLQKRMIKDLIEEINKGRYQRPQDLEYPKLYIDISDTSGQEKIKLSYGEFGNTIFAQKVLEDIEDAFAELEFYIDHHQEEEK